MMSKASPPQTSTTLQDYEAMLALSRAAMIQLDSDYRFLEASPSIVLLTGYKTEDLLGKSYLDLIVQGYQEAFHTMLGKSEAPHLDYPLLHKNGEWLWVRHSSQRIGQGTNISHRCMLQDVSHYKQPRDEIERERNLLRMIIDNIPDAIHAKDADGRYIFSNPAQARLLGKARPVDVLGQRVSDILPEENAARFEADDSEVLLNGKVIQHEQLYPVLENLEKWLNSKKMPMRDAKGNITGIIGIVHDISEQRRSQEQLSSSESRHRTLLNALPDMLFVVKKDGIISEFHAGDERSSLQINAQSLGKNISEIALPQGFLDEWQGFFNLALEMHDMQTFEFTLNNAGENYFYEARMLALNDEEVLTLVRDITPLKRIQDELSQHIDDLTVVRQVNVELAANLNFNYVVQLALDAALRLSNAQSGYIVMVEPLGNLACLSLIGEYDSNNIKRMLDDKKGIIPRVLVSLEPELLMDVQNDPDYYPLLSHTKAMMVIPLISNERLVGVLVLEAKRAERFTHERFQFLQLITGRIAAFLDSANLYRQTQEQLQELKQLYEEVRHLEQLKTDMIRIASHDLKNPLAGVMGYVEMLQMDMADKMSEKEKEYFQKIVTAARKMQMITSSILSLERIQQLATQHARETVDLREMLRRSIGEQMDAVVRNGQTLESNMPEGEVIVQADPMQLHEALFNLLNNAVKYTPRDGKITVTLAVEKDIVQFRVRDTGYGVPDDQQERLFSPFFRARTIETRFIEGTGLGLHLVKNIILRHEGEMMFESVYGKGSVFGFDIPLAGKKLLDDTKPKRP
jgi:PAS domain S-box-containing protein